MTAHSMHRRQTLAKQAESYNVSLDDLVGGNFESRHDLTRVACGWCGRRFWPDAARQKYCDHACYSASIRIDIQDRFWSKVNKNTASDCWLWTAATIRGYGQIAGVVNGKRRPLYAHRVSWELAHGPIVDDLFVLHRCDVPLCVNPAHLFLGTQADNLADARAKGRMIDGLGARKLSDDAYRDILTSAASSLVLARAHDVCVATIRRIRRGLQGRTYHDQQRLQASPAPLLDVDRAAEILGRVFERVPQRQLPVLNILSPEIGIA